MTINELIQHLTDLVRYGADPKAQVTIYDPDTMLTQRVSGSLYDPSKQTLELCSDDPS